MMGNMQITMRSAEERTAKIDDGEMCYFFLTKKKV